MGVYTRKFAEAFERVYAFEPDQINFKCLTQNLLDVDNVWLMCAALGETSQSVSLRNPDPNNCGTPCVAGAGDVPMLSIDSLNLRDVDCIHLDTEGYELLILMGAVKTIQQCNPLIVVEWLGHGEQYGWTQRDLIAFVNQLGYDKMTATGSDMMFKR